ncbi:hypothetical protein HK104_000787 [Borealophlyctis nickersoniae]|nr:hypothetical protein HK104_000787 [Borealophlyctis nickersoniae]
MTFANGEKGGGERAYRVKVYGERTWSWHGNVLGKLLYKGAQMTELVYEARFNEDYTYAIVIPFSTLPVLGRTEISPKLACFTLRKVSAGHWVRQSWFFCVRVFDYQFVRIADKHGVRSAEFEKRAKSRVPGRVQMVARKISK